MESEHNCPVVWTFSSTALLGNWDKDWRFPVLRPLLGFPNLLTHWVQHFNNIIFFRILNRSTGIPSPSLALLAAMLPKFYLTSHSRMPGFMWVITLSWLSRSLRSFSYSSSMYSCHLFLISLLLLGLYSFCSLLCPFLHEIFLWYFQFSWRDLQSFPFCCFPLFLCIVHWRMPSCLSLIFCGILHTIC